MEIIWPILDVVGKSGGVLALWNENNFKVDSIEYRGQWIDLFGVHASTKFSCVIVGVYASTSVSERQTLWNELTLLKSSFEVPMFLV